MRLICLVASYSIAALANLLELRFLISHRSPRIESEAFSLLYSELQAVKLKTIADLLALSLNNMLVPISEGVAAVALSCQLTLLALAEIQDIRPEFRAEIKANVLRRYRGSVASEYCIGLGLPEGIILPGDNPEDYGPLESNRLDS